MTPLLTPSVTSIWDVRGRGDEVGSSYRFRERFLGRDQEGRVEVVAVEPPHRFITLTTYDNGTTVRWEMRFEPAADHGTDGTDVSTTNCQRAGATDWRTACSSGGGSGPASNMEPPASGPSWKPRRTRSDGVGTAQAPSKPSDV